MQWIWEKLWTEVIRVCGPVSLASVSEPASFWLIRWNCWECVGLSEYILNKKLKTFHVPIQHQRNMAEAFPLNYNLNPWCLHSIVDKCLELWLMICLCFVIFFYQTLKHVLEATWVHAPGPLSFTLGSRINYNSLSVSYIWFWEKPEHIYIWIQLHWQFETLLATFTSQI